MQLLQLRLLLLPLLDNGNLEPRLINKKSKDKK
jgi:hypothetical protein